MSKSAIFLIAGILFVISSFMNFKKDDVIAGVLFLIAAILNIRLSFKYDE